MYPPAPSYKRNIRKKKNTLYVILMLCVTLLLWGGYDNNEKQNVSICISNKIYKYEYLCVN